MASDAHCLKKKTFKVSYETFTFRLALSELQFKQRKDAGHLLCEALWLVNYKYAFRFVKTFMQEKPSGFVPVIFHIPFF